MSTPLIFLEKMTEEIIEVEELEQCINIKKRTNKRYVSLSLSKKNLPKLIHDLAMIDLDMEMKEKE